MIPGWLSEAADYFWALAGPVPDFPRDLSVAAPRGFVVDEQTMLGLSISGIQRWFAQRSCDIQLKEQNRRLRGCLTAVGGSAVIFIDGADTAAEHRFTYAHEISHYLVDYLLPRERAVQLLGAQILEVIDGIRVPTEHERMDAALNACPLGLHYHLLERRDRSGRISLVETKADQLAWELLAPDHELDRAVRTSSQSSADLANLLIVDFGFPEAEAERYAEHWARKHFGPKPLIRLI